MKSPWSDEPVHTGVTAALLRDHIDTDALIASRDITGTGRQGLGPRLLAVWRFDAATGEPRPDFVLNQSPWNQATLLLAGRNFGCGSSREMAVWALMDFGIRAVIAPSFGEIFRGNALRNGLAPLQAEPQAIAQMAAFAQQAGAGARMTVDLQARRLRVAEPDAGPQGSAAVSMRDLVGPAVHEWAFELDEAALQNLLMTQDPIEIAMSHSPALAAHEQRDRERRPWAWNFPNVNRKSG